MRLLLTLFILASALITGACTKSGDPVSPGTTTTNAVKFSVNRGADQTTVYRWAEASFNTDSNLTVVGFSVLPARPSDTDESDGLVLSFPGKTTGNFTVGMTTGAILFRDSVMFIGISGSLAVTKYGNVGQTIEGTFTGRMIGFSMFGSRVDTIDVKEFRFSANRLADNAFGPIDDDGDDDGDDDDGTGITASFTISGPIAVNGNIVINDAFAVANGLPDAGTIIRFGQIIGSFDHNGNRYDAMITIPFGTGDWRTGSFPWTTPIGGTFGRFWMNLITLNDVTKSYQLQATSGTTIVSSMSGNILRGTANGTCTAVVDGEEVTVNISNLTFEMRIES
jgi:hypothetical protein